MGYENHVSNGVIFSDLASTGGGPQSGRGSGCFIKSNDQPA